MIGMQVTSIYQRFLLLVLVEAFLWSLQKLEYRKKNLPYDLVTVYHLICKAQESNLGHTSESPELEPARQLKLICVF